MKDYTKYNFNAIRGACVEMDARDGKGTFIHPRGKIVYQEKNTILIESEGKLVNRYYIYDIVPGSLSAKIKVEDMSLRQHIRFMETENFVRAKFDENNIGFKNEDGCLYLYFLDAYIDCTEWGWKE